MKERGASPNIIKSSIHVEAGSSERGVTSMHGSEEGIDNFLEWILGRACLGIGIKNKIKRMILNVDILSKLCSSNYY